MLINVTMYCLCLTINNHLTTKEAHSISARTIILAQRKNIVKQKEGIYKGMQLIVLAEELFCVGNIFQSLKSLGPNTLLNQQYYNFRSVCSFLLFEQSLNESKNKSIGEPITIFYIVRTIIRSKQSSDSEDRACADTSVKSREFLGTDQGTRELQLFLNCRANFLRTHTTHNQFGLLGISSPS